MLSKLRFSMNTPSCGFVRNQGNTSDVVSPARLFETAIARLQVRDRESCFIQSLQSFTSVAVGQYFLPNVPKSFRDGQLCRPGSKDRSLFHAALELDSALHWNTRQILTGH